MKTRLVCILALLPLLAGGQIINTGNHRIVAAPTWTNPTFVAASATFNSSSVTAVTSGCTTGGCTTSGAASFTLTSGDLVVVFCRSGTGANTTTTATSSPSNTFSSLPKVFVSGASPTGNDQMWWIFPASAGSTTFTCTTTNAGTFSSISVVQYHPGSLTTTDTNFTNLSGSGLSTYTSPSFNTTARGLVVMCADPQFGAGAFTAGTIGGVSANLRTVSTNLGFPPCEDVTTTTALSSVTGSVSTASGSGFWGAAMISFK